MIHQELLRRAVVNRHPIMQQFVETLAPQVLIAFSRIPALGGSGGKLPGERDPMLPPEAVEYTDQERQRFASNPDQSLAAHLFNGIFAGAHMAEILPPEKQLRDLEWQVWILGFIVHDYTKVHGIKIDAGRIPSIRNIVADMGDRLRFDVFLPDWKQYLDDVVFLAQNTQTVQGANLNWSLFPNLQLRERRLFILRDLAAFADVLVHITRPSDVVERDSRGRNTAQNLRTKLGVLFGAGQIPRLTYHQLTDVRGLLSNVINNALMRALEQQGCQPYLFFPDGVVYIVTTDQPANLETATLIDALWSEVGATLAGVDENESQPEDDTNVGETETIEGGLRINRTKDYMKVPPVLYELLSPGMLLLAGRQAAMRIRTPLAAERLGAEISDQRGIDSARLSAKEKKEMFAELGTTFMQDQGLSTDARVDQLAEFLGFIWRRMLRHWFPKSDWATRLLLDILELNEEISLERAEAARSGTPTGWFYVAARYIQTHSLEPDQLEKEMEAIGEKVLHFLDQHGHKPSTDGRFQTAFYDYVESVLTVDGQTLATITTLSNRFTLELQQYTERKASNKVVCSLCSSPYEARQQDKSEVIFKPQQYSNKTRLDTSTVVRGICPICAIEMMLRQVQQGMRAGSSQDEKPVTLFLYPTYFFTAETAQVIHNFVNLLRDLHMPDLIFNHLGRNGFTLDVLAMYENFVALDPADPSLIRRSLQTPTFSERDPASLFFFSFRAPIKKEKLTDTDAWIEPIFYALALPLLLDIKVVASTSFIPIYKSGAEFQSTVILDGPHSFTQYVLDYRDIRIDHIEPSLWRLLRLYELHLDVFKKSGSGKREDLHWGMLNAVAKDIATDPYYVFSYYDRKQRKPKEENDQNKNKKRGKNKAKANAQPETSSSGGIPPYMVDRYIAIYTQLGGETDMGFIEKLVDDYAQFYRADSKHLDSAYTILRPLGTAIDVTKNSSPDTEEDDLLLLIAGTINDEMGRVRHDPATSGGFDPIWFDKSRGSPSERLNLSMQAIHAFTSDFIKYLFNGYCKGNRGILRERANRIRSAAHFYYLANYARTERQPKADQNPTTATATKE
jgi:CRISPR-associated protein Csc3